MSDVVQRIMADTHSERLALFLCTTEGKLGESGEAVNERGELYGWWLFPNGHLDIRPYRVDELTWEMQADPEYLAALVKVTEPRVFSPDYSPRTLFTVDVEFTTAKLPRALPDIDATQ